LPARLRLWLLLAEHWRPRRRAAAQPLCYLLSDKAGWVTGATFDVDGAVMAGCNRNISRATIGNIAEAHAQLTNA